MKKRDGQVNSIDYVYMRKYLLGLINGFPNGEVALSVGDVDSNGRLTQKTLNI